MNSEGNSIRSWDLLVSLSSQWRVRNEPQFVVPPILVFPRYMLDVDIDISKKSQTTWMRVIIRSSNEYRNACAAMIEFGRMETDKSGWLVRKSRFLVIFGIWWWIFKVCSVDSHLKVEILGNQSLKSSLEIIDDKDRSWNVVDLN
jgi:hypothetical protein